MNARAAARSLDAAVDEFAQRLQRQVRRYVDRIATRQREPTESRPGGWRHGSLRTATPEQSAGPPEERRIERRQAFALQPMDIAEAVLEARTDR